MTPLQLLSHHGFVALLGFFAVLLVGCQEQSGPAQGLSPEPEEFGAEGHAIHWGYKSS